MNKNIVNLFIYKDTPCIIVNFIKLTNMQGLNKLIEIIYKSEKIIVTDVNYSNIWVETSFKNWNEVLDYGYKYKLIKIP